MSEGKVFRLGNIELRVDHRTLGGDGGPAVRVMAQVDQSTVPVLRFDCFREEPHYHYDPAGKDVRHDLEKNEVPDPIAWTLERLEHNLADMIRTAGYPDAALGVDQGTVADALEEVEAIMRAGP